MEAKTSKILLCLCAALITFSFFTKLQAQSAYDPHEFLIYFEPGTSTNDIALLKQFYNATENYSISPSSYSGIHLWKVTSFPTGNNSLNDINEVIQDARTRAEVNSAGLNYKTTMVTFEMPGIPPQVIDPDYYCSDIFSLSCSNGSKTIRLGILDTGIAHYIDTSNNVQFHNPLLFNPYFDVSDLGYDYVDNDPFPRDHNGHGSHIAGIIAGKASELSTFNLELRSYRTHNSSGYGDVYDIVRAVDDAIREGMHILNMSFSYQAPIPEFNDTEPLEVAIENAAINEILILASAGNSNYDNDQGGMAFYPASFDAPNIISIASVKCGTELSQFSNYGGTSVDVATLGEDVISPDANGVFVGKSGTSQSTAFTSAIAAMLASNLVDMSYEDVKCAILATVEPYSGLYGKIYTGGVVNANGALHFLLNDDCAGSPKSEEAPSSILAPEVDRLDIFPNPVHDRVHLTFENEVAGPVTLEFFNTSGQLLEQVTERMPAGEQNYQWDATASAATGMILVRIQQNGKILNGKFYRLP